MNKIIVFDVWGDYAHFRKIYTTTSPLSYSIPTRTAVCGLIGAIIGLSKINNDYLKYFKLTDAKIALKIITPIIKVRIPINLINTKEAKGIGMNLIKSRSQIRFEFIKSPKFRIYFWHNNKRIYDDCKNNLINHKSYYTPCLGLSENIANFNFVTESNVKIQNNQNVFIDIHSVIPLDKIVEEKGIDFTQTEREYFKEKIPIEMNTERIVKKYSQILYERNGKPIRAKLINTYFNLNYQNTVENIVIIE